MTLFHAPTKAEILGCTLLLAAHVACAQEAARRPRPAPARLPSPEAVSQDALPSGVRIEQLPEGGWIAIGERHILLVNLDPALCSNWLESQRLDMRNYLMKPIETQALSDDLQTPNLLETFESLKRSLSPQAVALIVFYRPNPENLMPPILTAPDSGWSAINTAWVEDGAESAAQAQSRLGRQAYRALGFRFGLPFTQDPNAVMRPIERPEDLDALSANFFPGNLTLFKLHSQFFGLESVRRLRPRQLIALGLAPPDMVERFRQRDAERAREDLPPEADDKDE